MDAGTLPWHARLRLYAIPAMMDLVAGIILFVPVVRAKHLGRSYFDSVFLTALWLCVVAATNLAAGRWIAPRATRVWCVVGLLGQAAACLGLAASSGWDGMAAWLVLSGVAHVVFFTPFQVLMKIVGAGGEHRRLAEATGLYVMAWGLGMAAGPLASGWLFGLGTPGEGWRLAFYTAAWMCAAALALLFSLARGERWRLGLERAEAAGAAEAPSPSEGRATPADGEKPPPDLAWAGWIGCGAMSLALNLVRGLFPAGAVAQGVPESVQGSVLGLAHFMQAVTGLALGRYWAGWMYRARPVVVLGLLGVLATAAFAFPALSGASDAKALASGYLAAGILFGVFAGYGGFYGIYHSLADSSRAGRNVAVNEAVLSLTGLAIPVLGGLGADAWGMAPPFLAAAAVVVFATAWQARAHRRHPYP